MNRPVTFNTLILTIATALIATRLLAIASAQSLTVTIAPATPFTISWDQPADDSAPSFRLWCDGSILKNFTAKDVTKATAANTDGTFTFTAQAPGLTAGTHSCLVSAFNEIGEAKSTAIPLTVGTAPATPLRLKVVVQIGGGNQ